VWRSVQNLVGISPAVWVWKRDAGTNSLFYIYAENLIYVDCKFFYNVNFYQPCPLGTLCRFDLQTSSTKKPYTIKTCIIKSAMSSFIISQNNVAAKCKQTIIDYIKRQISSEQIIKNGEFIVLVKYD